MATGQARLGRDRLPCYPIGPGQQRPAGEASRGKVILHGGAAGEPPVKWSALYLSRAPAHRRLRVRGGRASRWSYPMVG